MGWIEDARKKVTEALTPGFVKELNKALNPTEGKFPRPENTPPPEGKFPRPPDQPKPEGSYR